MLVIRPYSFLIFLGIFGLLSLINCEKRKNSKQAHEKKSQKEKAEFYSEKDRIEKLNDEDVFSLVYESDRISVIEFYTRFGSNINIQTQAKHLCPNGKFVFFF